MRPLGDQISGMIENRMLAVITNMTMIIAGMALAFLVMRGRMSG
ncbi:MAG: hypothetical protein OSB10_11060 [Planctomycetota bacterium]|nr:hypothetical protein [Planctomycetota bacterium]